MLKVGCEEGGAGSQKMREASNNAKLKCDKLMQQIHCIKRHLAN
jgi:hypothetical protein